MILQLMQKLKIISKNRYIEEKKCN